jgi:prephenate dehydrogenase
MKRLTVVGFGLIGGSFALAQKRCAPIFVTAVDLPQALAHPRAEEIADARVDVRDDAAFERAVADSTLTVVSAPVGVICRLLPAVLARAALVTDTGSTKRRIEVAARSSPRGARFVPGHPMAGSPEGGIERARADLFESRPWILCGDHAARDALASVEQWVGDTGAVCVHLTAAAHDAAVARTSHLPQLVASALLGVVERAGALPAAGPAFERLAHSAGGPEAMWRDIWASNADEIARALDELAAALGPVAVALASGRSEAAEELLGAARRLRRALDSRDSAPESKPDRGQRE